MGRTINLNTATMQCIGAYLAEPAGMPRGGVVVAQEIFGVNAHIRAVADRLATAGYTAIAPAFFDHLERDVVLAPDAAGQKRGMALAAELDFAHVTEDVGSAAASIASSGRIACVGFCWGGTVALLAAIRLGLPAVSFYGSRNVRFLDQPVTAPVQFHFGEHDRSIPAAAIERHRQEVAGAEVFTYPEAGHAFHSDPRDSYHAASAALAWQRTLDFLDRHLGPQ
ncbi:MAG TPA: dienelactone hydrolase family protein [Rhodanobacteraceae bacterium]|nr:dienelactone hydrolase family protein [Rhodanobacteraceae bacterium]